MTRDEMLKAIESITTHVGNISDAHYARLDGKKKMLARIPGLTQNPVGDMIARELADSMGLDTVPLKEHPVSEVITFALMSLEVELGNFAAALESEE